MIYIVAPNPTSLSLRKIGSSTTKFQTNDGQVYLEKTSWEVSEINSYYFCWIQITKQKMLTN